MDAPETDGNGDVAVGFAPPYPAFATFNSFLTALGSKPVPPRIDRSLMVGIANGVQTQVLAALREFGLIEEGHQVTGLLVEAIGSEEARKETYRRILTGYYAEQMALSGQRGTAAQLAESFRPSGYTGSTLRKAITFFLNMATAADVPLSPHFRAPSQRNSARKRPIRSVPVVEEAVATSPGPLLRNAVRVELPSGGALTLVCEVDFVHMSREDREFTYQLIDQLNEYPGSKKSEGHDQERNTE